MLDSENIGIIIPKHNIRQNASESVSKCVRGTETHEMTKHALEIEKCKPGFQQKVNKGPTRDIILLGLQKQKEMRENGTWKSTAEKFIKNPRIHKAVKRFCYECSGFSLQHATNCENTNCPLWLFRHGKTTPKAEELPIWQKAHKQWLQQTGEWKSCQGKPYTPDTACNAD